MTPISIFNPLRGRIFGKLIRKTHGFFLLITEDSMRAQTSVPSALRKSIGNCFRKGTGNPPRLGPIDRPQAYAHIKEKVNFQVNKKITCLLYL